MELLKFGKGNAKLDGHIWTFSLPAGWTCPGAQDCKSKTHKRADDTRYVRDGKHTVFRCFAATAEAQYKNTYNARQHNMRLLKGKTTDEMSSLILASLPKRARFVRVHVSGDFFNRTYFKAWVKVANTRPDVVFYAYTKSIPYTIGVDIPENLRLTASLGGKYDSDIPASGLRTARVVYSEQEAADFGLEIDHDDSHAIEPGGDFALLIHGTQPKGSEAAKALAALKGSSGYSAKRGRPLQMAKA